ncbi:hypothetical protein [Radiobacillus deserti]|uniref:Holin n=1 Tax=Radiobacillus deserti TaxID=2594883 RepID=A0A516KL09_9BACI|nr:hypothetical protein [Radiobacillus deserti]QDP42083.1 hypothetical protein FN924_03595 [Radiobacillus deserti]
MEFPSIHTNLWDVLFAVPVIMIFTQLIKVLLPIPKIFVPTIALLLGLGISIFVSHPHNFLGGVFMGWFYGYAAIGSYASLRTTYISYIKKQKKKMALHRK